MGSRLSPETEKLKTTDAWRPVLSGVEHSIMMVEQLGGGPFNRGALLNCGFLAAPESTAAVAILDVDLLPLPGVDFRLPTCATGGWPNIKGFLKTRFISCWIISACEAL